MNALGQSSAITITPVSMKDRQALGLRAGDTVRVHQKIEEIKLGKGANKKEVQTKQMRTQVFEGLVLAVKHGFEPGATFTVRKVASGVGVEKIFPLYSPLIDKIELVRRAPTRRAKLYYIREKVAREIKRQMRKAITVQAPEQSSAAPGAEVAAEGAPAPAEAAAKE